MVLGKADKHTVLQAKKKKKIQQVVSASLALALESEVCKTKTLISVEY